MLLGSFYFVRIFRDQIQCISSHKLSQWSLCTSSSSFSPEYTRHPDDFHQETKIPRWWTAVPTSESPWIVTVASFPPPQRAFLRQSSPSSSGKEGRTLLPWSKNSRDLDDAACEQAPWISPGARAGGWKSETEGNLPLIGSGEDPLLRCCRLLHILFHGTKSCIAFWTVIYRATDHILHVSTFIT